MSAFLDDNGKLVTVSATNKLPVEATNKALPTIVASATLQSTSDECVLSCGNYKAGSFTIQSSATASFTLAIYAVVDGVERQISCCSTASGNIFQGSLAFGASTTGIYSFEIPAGATHIKLKPLVATSGSVDVKLYLGESNPHQVSVRGGVQLLASSVRAGFMARAAVWNRESTTPVNANLTITGAARGTFGTTSGTALNTVVSYGDKFVAAAGADVAGTLIIDASPNSGTTYYPVASVALTQIGGTGNFGAYLEIPIVESVMRARLVNGASNQTNAYLTTKVLG